MSFVALVIVTFLIMAISVYFWSLSVKRRVRWTRERVRDLVKRLVDGNVSELEWLRFLSTPVFHDDGIEQFRRHCLEISLTNQPSSSGHHLSSDSERELGHLLQKFLSSDQLEV